MLQGERGPKELWIEINENVETFLLPTDAHNVKKHRVIKTF